MVVVVGIVVEVKPTVLLDHAESNTSAACGDWVEVWPSHEMHAAAGNQAGLSWFVSIMLMCVDGNHVWTDSINDQTAAEATRSCPSLSQALPPTCQTSKLDSPKTAYLTKLHTYYIPASPFPQMVYSLQEAALSGRRQHWLAPLMADGH